MIIRKADTPDIPALAACQVAMAKESEGMVLDLATVTCGIGAIVDDPGKGTYYLAFDIDKLAGMLLITREWSDWRNKWVFWIQSVYTLPAYRRKGIYTALYRYIQEMVLRSPDVCGIRLYADKNNVRAITTYRLLGMSDEHYATFEWMK